MGGWSGQGKGSCGQLSSLIKSRIDGEHPFGPFRLLNKGWCNNNKPGNRKARLPLLNPASFEAKDTSKRKRAEVLTTAKTFTVQHFPPQSLIPNLRANKYRFKLQMNATNCFEASSLEAWKENLGRKPQFASLRIYKTEYVQRIRNSKVCTKHLLVHLEVTVLGVQTNKQEARSACTPTRSEVNSLEPNSSTTKPDSRSLPSPL